MPSPKWSIEADYIQACNCDYGCPCEFEAPPTMGYCEGMGAYKINSGQFNDISLNGLGIAFVLHFPKAMHLGNGTGGWMIDERANAAQRKALMTITSGKAGGMPFEIFTMIFSKFMDYQFLPFQFNLDGRNSSVSVGQSINVAVEPIKNPVTGSTESVRIEHATGFIFKGAECVSARQSVVDTPLIKFSWPGKAGFVTQIKYGN